MEPEMQAGVKELANLLPIVLKQGFGWVEDDEDVNVADIVFSPELMLDELVELIEIDISEELRCQVPEWHALGAVVAEDYPYQPKYLIVLDSPKQYAKQDLMVDIVEIMLDVCLEHIASGNIVF